MSSEDPFEEQQQGADDDINGFCIGMRIRAARRYKRMTLADLAKETGCSLSLLSRIENDKSPPSVQTLIKLASVLKLDIASFFKSDRQLAVLFKPSERQTVPDLKRYVNTVAEVLNSPTGDWRLEGYLFKLGPGGHGGTPTTHEGEEMGYVVEGKLELTVNGQTYVAEKGDSFHFPSYLEHSYRNLLNTQTSFICVHTPPPSLNTLQGEA